MRAEKIKSCRRVRRKRGIRKRIFGTGSCPRVSVFRSLQHIYAQIIDDERGVTLCSACSSDKTLRDEIKYGGNVAAAKVVGGLKGWPTPFARVGLNSSGPALAMSGL